MFYFITHKNDTVINKCLLPSWKGSKKRKPAVPKPAVVSQGTQPSQNPGSKEDDKKKTKKAHPRKQQRRKGIERAVIKTKENLSLMMTQLALNT